MKQQQQSGKIPVHNTATEYLANERTFLAWIRTSIAVISLGFVVAKFGLWLGELAAHVAPQLQQLRTGSSIPIGIAMIAFGGLLAILAAWRYHVVNHQIEQGDVTADRGLVILVTVLVALLSMVMIAYMLISVERL
jgi:putative membrane protein